MPSAVVGSVETHRDILECVCDAVLKLDEARGIAAAEYLLTFFAGALFMSLVIVASNSQPGWMFLFGAIMASCVILVSRRRLRRRVGAVAVGSGTGTTASELAGVGVDVETHPNPARMDYRVGRDIRKPRATDNKCPAGSEPARQLHLRERRRTATDEPQTRRAPKHCNSNRKAVQSAMLRPTQQDVLSALINLKVPYDEAYSLVVNTSPGVSFDELFRRATQALTAGKTRRAAA
jgi:hypothetical protein